MSNQLKPEPERITEQELVLRVQASDPAAEKLLFEEFGGRVDALVRNRLGYRSEAGEDLAMSIKVTVWKEIMRDRFQPDKGSLITWIYAIAQNQINNYFRDNKKFDHVPLDSVPETLISLVEDSKLEREELLEIILECFSELDEKYSRVLYRKYCQGMKTGEIAKELGETAQKISEWANYAIKLVKKKLEARGIFQDFAE